MCRHLPRIALTLRRAFGINGIFPQYLATTSVSVSKRSYYALPQTAFAIVTTVAGGFACDIFGKRWRINFVQGWAGSLDRLADGDSFGMILAAGVYLGYDNISAGGRYFALVFGGIGCACSGRQARTDVSRYGSSGELHVGERGWSLRL